MAEHYCETMRYWADFECSEHNDRFECPDSIIYFKEEPRRYGVIIHDGGSSFIQIAFCPWCSASLEKGKKK